MLANGELVDGDIILDTTGLSILSCESPLAPQHVAKVDPFAAIPHAQEWNPPHVTKVWGPSPVTKLAEIPVDA